MLAFDGSFKGPNENDKAEASGCRQRTIQNNKNINIYINKYSNYSWTEHIAPSNPN